MDKIDICIVVRTLICRDVRDRVVGGGFWISDDGAHLREYKHTAHTKPEEQGQLKLTTALARAGKLLPNQNDLINKSRPSHSSLVVARLSQVVAL
jgi:hypothetical protein